MSNATTRSVLILAIIACAAAAYFLLAEREMPQQQSVDLGRAAAPPVDAASPPNTETIEVMTRHPVPEADTAQDEAERPLPALEDSDQAIEDALSGLFGPGKPEQFLIFKNFITSIVVTVDNLPRTRLPVRRLPVKPPRGGFLVKKMPGGESSIDPENYKRYLKYVRFFEAADGRKLAAIYFHFYPLFQDAYRDLGYKSAYFNDRLIEAIDDLLATPDVTDPVRLVQPSVFYKYADPHLERLSAGERLMLRIGKDNAEKVKAKLRELRNALTNQNPGG
jgi:hypothetical protein